VTPQFRKLCLAAAVSLMALSGPALAHAAAKPPSARVLTQRPTYSNVSVSPDGKHIVAIVSEDGKASFVAVWDTGAMDKQPVMMGAEEGSTLMGASFIKNDRILITMQKPWTFGSYKTHIRRSRITDFEPTRGAKKMLDLAGKDDPSVRASIVSRLPLDPRNILVNVEGDYFKMDVYTGAQERVYRGSEKYGYTFDSNGEVRLRRSVDFENGQIYFLIELKNPKTGEFEPHFKYFGKDRDPVEVVGYSKDPNIVYISASQGQDKVGIYTYDIAQKKILEPLFQHKMFESTGVIQSMAKDDYLDIVGYSYDAERTNEYWEKGSARGAQLDSLNKAIRGLTGSKTTRVPWIDPASGDQANVSVVDGAATDIQAWSDDMKVVIAVKSGPKQPPEFYLIKDGKSSLFGKSRASIDVASLGDTRLVQYAARDGLRIPGILTTPPASFGTGPFPTIILPHGGPWARDHMEWDVSGWTQYFASRGYAVLQPQFRGSMGWGRKLWTAGDSEWGQKMQDDKDDGAKWLIDEKIADPKRIAMFGYSYGGYAALAATIRPNGLYQCAVSGAGGSLADMKKATAESRLLREFQRPFVGGLDAIQAAGEAKIPIFLYHGDRDTIVDIKDSLRFINGLKAAGKPYKWLEIKDMGHGYATMTPDMMETQLVEIEKFFQNECKPGGL